MTTDKELAREQELKIAMEYLINVYDYAGDNQKTLADLLARYRAQQRLEEAKSFGEVLIECRRIIRGRHSTLTYGPKALLDRIDRAIERIAALEHEAESLGATSAAKDGEG